MAPPIRTRPSIPLSQSVPSGSIHKPLSFSIRGQTDWKPQSQKTGPHPCLSQWNYETCRVGPPQADSAWRRVLTKHGPPEWDQGNGKPLQCSCLENPLNSMKRQKDRTLKDELPRSVDAQYAIGDQWRNNSRKNEETEPKQKQHPAVDVTGDGSKVWCCKEQYCIGTWNVRSMNQDKLEVIK